MNAQRWRAWRAYRVASSSWVVAGIILGVAALALGTIATFIGWLPSTQSMLGVGLLVLSIVSVLSHGFIFATSYLPRKGIDRQSRHLIDRIEFSALSATGASLLHLERTQPTHLFNQLAAAPLGRQYLERLELTSTDFSSVAREVTVLEVVEHALTLADHSSERLVSIEHLLAAFLGQAAFAATLRAHDLREEDAYFVARWLVEQRRQRVIQNAWWREDRLLAFSGVGLSWVAGFTPLVNRFARLPVGNLWDQFIVGREAYVDQLVTTLARERQTNVLLVGQPGTGRLGVVKELARRVRAHQAHPELDGQRVVYVHVGEILAQGNSSAEQLAIVTRVLTEMEQAGNIIAVIDGLGSVLGQEGEGRLNLSEVLLPFFSSLTVRVVVIISSDEYHMRLKTNEELLHFFELVSMNSSDPATAQAVLAAALPTIEQRANVYVPYRSMRALVDDTRGLLQHIPYPERAFDVLEEALVVAQAHRETVLTEKAVTDIISQKTGVPLGRLETVEREKLLDLDQIMHRHLVNQDHAVQAVAQAMIRARAGVRDTTRPIGSFLFLGPTGVGKTETAKTLARVYFGAADAMIRLDMSEFQGEAGLGRLIGSATSPAGRLTTAIAEKPFSVVLLDEFEKAHPMVHQLFLQVFDEGHLTDARGQTVSFEHSIIIATSNAGAEFIREAVSAGPLPANFDETLREFVLQQGTYRPELLNRFDGVITFVPLSPDHIRQVAKLMVEKLNERLDAEHGIRVVLDDTLLEHLVAHGYNPEFGARPMQRAIQDLVEYPVAKAVVGGVLTPGQQVHINPADKSVSASR